MKDKNINWEETGFLEVVTGGDRKRELKRLLISFVDVILSSKCEEIENIILPIYVRLYRDLKLPLGKFELVVDEAELIEDAMGLWRLMEPLKDNPSIDMEAECCALCVDLYIEKLKKNHIIKRDEDTGTI